MVKILRSVKSNFEARTYIFFVEEEQEKGNETKLERTIFVAKPETTI